VILTIVKIIIIYLFFQHIVIYDGETAHIARAYAWGELVDNMHQGEYVNTSQYSLAHLYDFKFHALRPPLYAFWLYFVSLFGKYAGFVAVLGQSIITSLIAWMGYKIVSLNAKNRLAPVLTLFVLFFLPMNFLKSGTLDDATFMLLFLLSGIYYLMIPDNKQKVYIKYMIAGLFFGLALLTRPAALFPIAGIFFYMLLSKYYQLKYIFIAGFIILMVLLPWLIRNNMVIGKPVYVNGGGRILLLLQSQEFIDYFPKESIDFIDQLYFTKHYEELKYINDLSELEKDKEFTELAKKKLISHPENLFKSVLAKSRVFIPDRYYPHREGFWKNTIHILQYAFALVVLIVSLPLFLKMKNNKRNQLILVSIVSYLLIGVVLLLLSRHFYPLIVLMLIFSGSILSYKGLNKIRLND